MLGSTKAGLVVIITGICLVLGLVLRASPVFAPEANYEKVARQIEERDRLRNFFKANGCPWPRESAEVFVGVAERYSLPFSLLPAIGMVESGCGKAVRFATNPFGWSDGRRNFISLDVAIDCVGKTIATGPAYKGYQEEKTLASLNRTYAEDPQWAAKVHFWMDKIESY